MPNEPNDEECDATKMIVAMQLVTKNKKLEILNL
jgi:hypothetical protein